MPLKLRPPRPGKSPNFQIRGTHHGISIERSTGTSQKKLAQKILHEYKRAIERGDFTRRSSQQQNEHTFLTAVAAYLHAGGDGTYLGPIIEMTGPNALRDLALSQIDQVAIDKAAAVLYPQGTPQTTNRQFYTPVSAVLKRAGVDREIKRPVGWRGKRSKSALEPEQAFALLGAASALDREFGLLCTTLLYTGMRIGEALGAEVRHLYLNRVEPVLELPETKNGEPRSVFLPPIVVNALRTMPPRTGRFKRPINKSTSSRGVLGRSQTDAGIAFLARSPGAKLFRFYQGGHLRKLLATAMRDAGLSFPRRQRGFHLFCHTYGTWMVRFAGLDNFGLTRTGRWKDPRSAEIYVHTKINAEALLAANLPTPPQPGKKRGIGWTLEVKG